MTTRFKYPRTPHLPWSPGVSNDDIRQGELSHFSGKAVVVTEKMDGENTTLYQDYSHARSIDSRHHPSRDWMKGFHSAICRDIPAGWRICGENLYAQHAIVYDALESYFYGFSIWNEDNQCLSWDDTMLWFDMLGITPPSVLYQGLWDEAKLKALVLDTQKVEGYVVRLACAFDYSDFTQSVAKWVRKGHVQTDKHWMQQVLKPNGLKKGSDNG